ncbi:MAG: hypothetical protein J6V88_05180 [Kiritimatiellae bacterium]|nr:hypothetical protein [Kiritimatiellia bacterium]
MKIKNDTNAGGSAIIADRFKIDAAPAANTAPAGKLPLIALISSIIAIGLVGATATMLYMNWEYVKGL